MSVFDFTPYGFDFTISFDIWVLYFSAFIKYIIIKFKTRNAVNHSQSRYGKPFIQFYQQRVINTHSLNLFEYFFHICYCVCS